MTADGWQSVVDKRYDPGVWNVMPIADTVQHQEGTACPCGPLEFMEGRVLRHHAADGRPEPDAVMTYAGNAVAGGR